MLKQRLKRGGRYARLLNEEPASAKKARMAGARLMENVERGEERREEEGGCEKRAIVSFSFSPLLLKDESFIPDFISC